MPCLEVMPRISFHRYNAWPFTNLCFPRSSCLLVPPNQMVKFFKYSVSKLKNEEKFPRKERAVWTSDLGPLRSAAKPPLTSSKSEFKSSPMSESMWKTSTFSSSRAAHTCALCRCSPLAFSHTWAGTASLTYQQPPCQRGLCQANLKKKVAESCNGNISSTTLLTQSAKASTFSEVTGDFFLLCLSKTRSWRQTSSSVAQNGHMGSAAFEARCITEHRDIQLLWG